MEVTIIIPTFNRPDELEVAKASACAQTEPCDIIIMNDGASTGRPEHPILSWYEGVYRASTEYVCLLFDDDWLEPTFVNRCLSKFEHDVGFVFTDAHIHFKDGARVNLGFGFNRSFTSERMIDLFTAMAYTITPSCCLFRRQNVLDHLYVNKIPGWHRLIKHGLAGPECLMSMLIAHNYARCEFISEPLSNLGAGETSTTISALQRNDGKLKADYDDVKRFFKMVTA